MSIVKSILVNHFGAMEKRGWDKTYWFVDLHSTAIKGNYQAGNVQTEFYPYAKEVLQIITEREDIALVMYTCSHPHEIEQYVEFFKEHEIRFDFINRNPEVITDKQGYGCYDEKPYINVLFDDKAGFDGETDWKLVFELLCYKYGITEYKGLDEDDKEQLFAEIDNEGLGYWVQHYTRDWMGKNYELDQLLRNAKNSMISLNAYLDKNVFDEF